MGFGYYRIGANTPSGFSVPVPRSVRDTRSDVMRVYGLAADTPNSIDGFMGVSNFMTGQKNGSVMGYYKQGASVGGAWVATPAFLKDELARLLGEATSLGKDVRAYQMGVCEIPGGRDSSIIGDSQCARVNRFVENTWSPFLKEIHVFVKSHEGWASRLWGSLYSEIQEYRKRLIGLRTFALNIGIEATAPAPLMPPKSALGELGSALKTVLYFVAGGFIIWLIFNSVLPALKGMGAAAV